MNSKLKKHGFSLAEVMMASAILAVGLLMVAGTFPVGIFLTAGSVEQTIAPVVADEAFAKIRLYDVNMANPAILLPLKTNISADFNDVTNLKTLGPGPKTSGIGVFRISSYEYLYPSAGSVLPSDRIYSWSAICRRVVSNDSLVQLTVFVSKKGNGLKYLTQSGVQTGLPTPVKIHVVGFDAYQHVSISETYINDGCTIVSDATGNIYRVLEHSADAGGGVYATLDRNWTDPTSNRNGNAWMVPPPINPSGVFMGRSPVIGVYQRIIKF